MKKLLPVSLVINAVLIVAAVFMIFGPVVGSTFSKVNTSLSSAGGASPDYYAQAPVAVEAPGVAPQAGVVEAPAAVDANQETFTAARLVTAPVAQPDRIVIKNADLAIVVSDVNGHMKDIQNMAQQMGGFVVSSNLYKSYTNNNVQVPEAQIVVRVPAEKLDDALTQIKKDTVDVQNETISGQDVTSEYVDLQSRLKNLQDAESQLNGILKSATDTTDVVTIFNQLVSYREQIEVIKGQIKYYDESAALSSITVRIIAEETTQPIVIGKWEPKGIALQAVQDLINFLKNFTEFAIRFVIYILPSWLIVGIPLYLIFLGGRAIFRKMRSKKVEQEKPQETSEEKK